MSFKKTSEGRVYFQGSKKTANDWPEEDMPATRKPIKVSAPQAPAPEVSNIQIVSLLRALNEKLQMTQAERREMRREIESYRSVVENLQSQTSEDSSSRAIAAEEIAQSALRELEETRKLILQIETKAERADKGVSTLKTQLVKSVQKLENFEVKLTEAEANQAKMLRQFDKATEERARFMRKIERIEEAVLQTQEALNAKAMVLLTDQNARAQTVEAIQDGIMPSPRKEPLADDFASQIWWKRPWEMSGAIVTALLALTVLATWGVSEFKKSNPDQLNFGSLKLSEKILPPAARQPALTTTSETPNAEPTDTQLTSLSEIEPAPTQTEKQNFQEFYNNLSTTTSEPSAVEPAAGETPTPIRTPVEPVNDDVGTIDLNDDEQLLKALEKNPDAVAAELNKLEPSTTAPQEEIAYAPPQETIPPVEVKQPSAGPRLSREALIAKIKPDSSLPASLKDIQEQAYNGIPEAQHDLAAIYTAGHGGVEQDYKRASFWFEQAAAQDIPNAAYNLGVLYHQGLGVQKNLARAIEWYQDAASLGHPEAQYNLGIAYIEGIGVPYNAEIAARNFKSAADKGITEAAYNLGLIYENGLLGESKPQEALMWYKTAADQGNPEAKQALEQLAKTLGISLDEVNRIADSMKETKKSDLNIQSTNKFAQYTGQEQVLTAQVQEYLATAGTYNGPATGFNSPATEEAIRTYQSENNLVPDGKISKNLLSHMLASGTEYGSRE